jgi:chorismate mutase
VRLLCQRIKLAINIGKQKMKLGNPISNPLREKQVLEYVSNLPHAPLQNRDLIDLFQKIMTICRMAQGNGE